MHQTKLDLPSQGIIPFGAPQGMEHWIIPAGQHLQGWDNEEKPNGMLQEKKQEQNQLREGISEVQLHFWGMGQLSLAWRGWSPGQSTFLGFMAQPALLTSSHSCVPTRSRKTPRKCSWSHLPLLKVTQAPLPVPPALPAFRRLLHPKGCSKDQHFIIPGNHQL